MCASSKLLSLLCFCHLHQFVLKVYRMHDGKMFHPSIFILDFLVRKGKLLCAGENEVIIIWKREANVNMEIMEISNVIGRKNLGSNCLKLISQEILRRTPKVENDNRCWLSITGEGHLNDFRLDSITADKRSLSPDCKTEKQGLASIKVWTLESLNHTMQARELRTFH